MSRRKKLRTPKSFEAGTGIGEEDEENWPHKLRKVVDDDWDGGQVEDLVEEESLSSASEKNDDSVTKPPLLRKAEAPKTVNLSPELFLMDAVLEVMRHSYGRYVSCGWVGRSLLHRGWQPRFGDFCDLSQVMPATREESEKFFENLVRCALVNVSNSPIVVVKTSSIQWVFVIGEDYLLRRDLEEVYDLLDPINSDTGRIKNSMLEGLFANEGVSATMLIKWRKGNAQSRLKRAFPTELALDVVARTVGLTIGGCPLKLLALCDPTEDAREKTLDFDVFEDNVAFWTMNEDGSLELCSRRGLFVARITAANRQLLHEASILQLLKHFRVNEMSPVFGLCLVALYASSIPQTMLSVLQSQLFEEATLDLHCNEEQMLLFADQVCEFNWRSNCSFVRDRLPALLFWQRRGPSVEAPVLVSEKVALIDVYRAVKKGRGKERMLLMPSGENCVSVGSEVFDPKNAPSRIFFRVRLPIEAAYPLCCLATSPVANVVRQNGGLVFAMHEGRSLRLVLSRREAYFDNHVDPSTCLVLESWNEAGGVLVVQEGFLMGMGELNQTGPRLNKKKCLALKVLLDEVVVAETMLWITTSGFNVKTTIVEELNPELEWAPQNLLKTVRESSGNVATVPVDESEVPHNPAVLICPEVGEFVMEVGWHMMFGGSDRNNENYGQLRADDLVRISAVVQQSLQDECFALASDLMDLQKRGGNIK
jgi:hypothetical protein